MTTQFVFMAAAILLASVSLGADRNCRLLTAEEANAVFGTSLRAGAPAQSDDGKPICQYTAPDETMMIVGVVDKNGRAAFGAQKSSLADNPGRPENVPGLGDEAVLQVFSKGGGTIGVRRGDSFFAVAIAGRKAIPVKDGLIQLARKALARL